MWVIIREHLLFMVGGGGWVGGGIGWQKKKLTPPLNNEQSLTHDTIIYSYVQCHFQTIANHSEAKKNPECFRYLMQHMLHSHTTCMNHPTKE